MGDDYTGPVTVAADDGSKRVLADFDVWSQSETIMEMVKDTDPGDTVPLASVSKNALEKAVVWMEKMAAFKADGTSDEDKLTWIKDEYKESMAPQEQLPLLFQTMNAANFMNIKDLLDELCKFVAEMIASRTPDEILTHFGIEKGTVKEEQELIATHKWIDPEGLIAKDREAKAADRAGKEAAAPRIGSGAAA